MNAPLAIKWPTRKRSAQGNPCRDYEAAAVLDAYNLNGKKRELLIRKACWV